MEECSNPLILKPQTSSDPFYLTPPFLHFYPFPFHFLSPSFLHLPFSGHDVLLDVLN